MKVLRPLLFSCLMLLTFGGIKGQDIHFTMFNMSPLTLNPALAGSYYGTARIGGVYRDQWASFLRDQFTTPVFYIDAPIVRGLRKQDWIGIGIVTINDQAGTGNLRTQGSLLTAAYHLGLDKKASKVLSLGIQVGSMSRRVDVERLIFADSYDDQGRLSQESADAGNILDKQTFLDINGGLLYKAALDDDSNLEVGLSVGHITQSDYNLLSGAGAGSDESSRPMRITAHGRMKTQLNDKWSLTPGFIAQSTKGALEISAQAWAGYAIKDNIEILGGLSYRVGDAAALMIGAQYEDLRVGLAYDFNVSSLSAASNNLGGFELAAYYIIKLYQQPNVKRAILCPEF